MTRQHYSSSGLLQRPLRIPPSLPWNQSSRWSNANSYSHGHWQLGLCRSSTQLSKSLKTRLFRLLDLGFYFYTIMAIPGRWLRQAVKQTNEASIKKIALNASRTHSHHGCPAPFAPQEMCRHICVSFPPLLPILGTLHMLVMNFILHPLLHMSYFWGIWDKCEAET